MDESEKPTRVSSGGINSKRNVKISGKSKGRSKGRSINKSRINLKNVDVDDAMGGMKRIITGVENGGKNNGKSTNYKGS